MVKDDPVRYYLRLAADGDGDGAVEPDRTPVIELALNPLIGRWLRVESQGRITCQHCGARTRRSYAQGYCYRCFTTLARCDLCVMSPDRCHYDQGTCREPDWADGFCMMPHTVYVAVTSGPKVGITRSGREFERWADQGAQSAMRLLDAPTRKAAGIAEATLARALSDRTVWRDLVSRPAPDCGLPQLAADLRASFETGLSGVRWLDAEPVTTLGYPIERYSPPDRRRLSDDGAIEGRLCGIRGQYLLFDEFVFNIREHTSNAVVVSVADGPSEALTASKAAQPQQARLFD